MFLLNGQRTDSITLHERGLHYGDGLFETVAVIDQNLLCWEQHLDRLLHGCERLRIQFNDFRLLQAEVESACLDLTRAVLKIIITSGIGGRGYKRPKTGLKPNRIIGIYPWPNYPNSNVYKGIKAHLCSTRLGHIPHLAGIKHLNRLEQILARNEWYDPSIAEGLMLDFHDKVIAGTMSNVFIISSGKTLVTPELSFCGIRGVVRQCIFELAPILGYKKEVKNLTLTDVYAADEIFFCNSIAGIWPVKQLAEHKYPVGPVSLEVRAALETRRMIALP